MWRDVNTSRFVAEFARATTSSEHPMSPGSGPVAKTFRRVSTETPGGFRADGRGAPIACGAVVPVRSSTCRRARSPRSGAHYRAGARVFHQKFGYGEVISVDGDKLDIDFDKAGTKKVMAGFVVPAEQAR